MPLMPGYGETPLSADDAEALVSSARELLGEPISKADVYDLEQAVQEEVVEQLVTAVLAGTLAVDELLTDYFLRKLHRRLYGGRATRLLADLVYLAAQDAQTVFGYVWDLDKSEYITLLREYDRHRDPAPLAAFVDVRALDA